jgi:hypothetical protein
MLKRGIVTALIYMAAVMPGAAHHKPGHEGGPPSVRNPVAVPEIDASTGLLALAAIATVLLFVWERRRRQP